MVRLMNKWNMELLLLQTLFFHKGHSDDSVYCSGEEDGVCRGKYLGFKVKGARFTVNERAVSTVHHQSISGYTARDL